MDLRGKVVVITGAGSGLGAALARGAARRGAHLVIAGRRAEKLEETRQSCGDAQVLSVPTDIADHAQCERLISTAIDELGALDVLVNNAGIGYGGGAGDVRPEEVQYNMQVNLVSPIWLAHLAQPHLQKRPEAAIVNIISLSGLVAMPSQQIYSASKFGLAGFSQALRRDLLDSPIHVLEVYPAAMDTEINTPEMRAAAEAQGGKVVAMPPDRAASVVLRALEKNKKKVLIAAAPPDRLIPILSRTPLFAGLVRKIAPAIRAFMLKGNEWIRSRHPLPPLS